MLGELDRLKKELDSRRPLTASVLNKLRDHLIIEWTYHSNSIEGSTLTLNETKVVLQDGITIRGKSVREHLEAINHKEAILLLLDLVQEEKPFSERDIKDLHSVILRAIDRENAGRYRRENVIIVGAAHIPPDFLQVEDDMQKLMTWYYTEGEKLHPVERAAMLHNEFVRIHPFVDGNGRTARLLLNLELMRNGYVPVVIKVDDRQVYYDVLDEYGTKRDARLFIKMVEKLEKEALQLYLYLAGKE